MSLPFQPGGPNPPNAFLSPLHIQYLTDRAVDPSAAFYGAGVRTVTAEEGARLVGARDPLPSPGLLVPYLLEAAYGRIRLDIDGSWRVPAGVAVPIYPSPGCALDGDKPLFIVEGPVKALALQGHGFDAIGLGGVATTLTKDHQLNKSWRSVSVRGRTVYVVFDAGRALNVEVARAEARLVLALEAAGAKVFVVAVPLLDGGDRGPDDFLAAQGPEALRALIGGAVRGDPVERATAVADKPAALQLLEDLPFLLAVHVRGPVVDEKVADALKAHKVTRTLVREAVKNALKRAEQNAPPSDASPTYVVRDGCLCLLTADGVGEHVEPLCNFVAEIVEEQTVDDGSGVPVRVFVLAGVTQDGEPLHRITVDASEFGSEIWTIAKWGSGVMVTAKVPRAARHLLNAVSVMSTGKTSKIVAYGHTGFRQRDGQWFYLHGGGAVGASGLTVALEGSAARFILPDCAGDVRAAVLESIAFLDIATMRISFPIHAGVHRAPLNEVLRCDAALDLVGTTGTMKSAVMGVAQSHYGSFDYNSLPLNFESTANSLEAELFRLKDTFVVIDEYVPTGGSTMSSRRKRSDLPRHRQRQLARPPERRPSLSTGAPLSRACRHHGRRHPPGRVHPGSPRDHPLRSRRR